MAIKKSSKASTKGKAKKAGKGGGKSGGSGEALTAPETRKSYIAGQTFGLKEITYGVVDGLAMFEGDIVLGTVEEMESIRRQVEATNIAEAVAVLPQFRWTGGVVPFRINSSLTGQQRVHDAIAHWQQRTGIRFRPRTTEANFVTFTSGNGCSAHVGMRGGEQFVFLGPTCSLGNVIHEIGHTVGLWHEQSREDRNTFVRINFPNINPGNVFNFDQHITDGDDIGRYDYASIMHYPRTAFAINTAIDTITPIPDASVAIGQRNGLSAGDIAAVNAMYPRKATLGETSNNGPAITTRSNQLLLCWTGTGNLRLNFMTSNDGLNFANKVTLGDTSPVAPAVAVFNNKFVVAWVGVGNNRLNVMQSNNGLTWSSKVTLGDTSLSSPSLAVLANRLFLAWRGVGNNQLNVMSSTNGTTWGGKVTLGDTTTSGPALTTLGTRLLLGWRGVGNNQLNVMRSTNGTTFTGKVTLGETTVSRVGLTSLGGRAFLTWQGVGNLKLNVLASNDGATWGSKLISNETCIDGPAIGFLGNDLVWSWSGTDPAHRLNTLLFMI